MKKHKNLKGYFHTIRPKMKNNLIFFQKIKPGLIIPAKVSRIKKIKFKKGIIFSIRIKTDGEIIKKIEIDIPFNNEINPASNLSKWKSFFNEYPFSNQKVFLVMNKEGKLVFPYEIKELKRYDNGLSDLQKLEKYCKRDKKNGIRTK
jgi:hypothetical protein